MDAEGEGQNFETQFSRLQEIVRMLESANVSLENAVVLYKEGASLVRDCRERLRKAQNDIQVFSEGLFIPFEGEEAEGENAGMRAMEE